MRSVLYGYRIENGEPVIEPREADRVRAAFASFAKNGNLAQALRDSGIQKNHPFMSLMLKNPRYKGDDFYPEIIDGKKWLTTSPDPVKDQTDFLAQIYGWQLQKAIFPIGHYVKDEVRQIAEREHLVNAKRKDSQGICFLGKIDYTEYVRRYVGEQQGDVIELETGKLIGRHNGHWFYTIGQRKGLGFGGGPWFIVKKDVEKNILYVAHGYDPSTVYKQSFAIHDFHSINGEMPEEDITFKIRHTPEYHRAKFIPKGEGRYEIQSEEKIHGVAPGQFCVIYDNRHHRCYGSGEITI